MGICGPFFVANSSTPLTPGEQLCLSCGMCCDGTLFDGVQLEAGDSVKELRGLGLPVTVYRARPPVARFPQPCAALCADRTCRIYADRPQQCRKFECGVFKKLKAGEIGFAAASKLVKKARAQGEKMRRLFRRLGDQDEHRGLGERFFRMQCRVEEKPVTQEELATFADLSLAMHRFKLVAHDHFYTPPEKEKKSRGKSR